MEHRDREVQLSVVVPCRNVSAYVDRWRSIVEQDVKEELRVQWIFVDDASTDGAFNDIRAFQNRDLLILSLASRSGPGVARNFGLHHCTGKFVVFADADDLIDIGAFRHGLRETLERTDGAEVRDIVAFQYAVRIDDGRIVFRSRSRDGTSLAQLLTRHVAVWRFAWSTDFLRAQRLEFPPLSYGEDLMFCLSAALSTPRLTVRQEVAYVYSARHVGSATFGCSWTQDVDKILPMLESLRQTAPPGLRRSLEAWAVRIAMRAAVTPCHTPLAVRWKRVRWAVESLPLRPKDWSGFVRAMNFPNAIRRLKQIE